MAQSNHYRGTFDPLRTYFNLRNAGMLGDDSYIHVHRNGAEIGWAPIARAQFLDGQAGDAGDASVAGDWRTQLAAFADRAAALDNKAFGYVGFDAADGQEGVLPDRSAKAGPLVQFIIPGERIEFSSTGTVHHSTSGQSMWPYLAVKSLARQRGKSARETASNVSPRTSINDAAQTAAPTSAVPDHIFMAMVEEATKRLRSRELEKIVLSRFEVFDAEYDPLDLFAAFCASPTLVDAFLISFGDTTAIVASPELLVGSHSGHFETNPLAGTRPRGTNRSEDDALRKQLQFDHKEMVEHVISVTTMLDQLTPVCKPDSVVVQRLMEVQKQQKVQHMSSLIRGQVAEDRHILDVLWALFPSIAVCGYSKADALKWIRTLEDAPRWLYAGACGWVAGPGDAHLSLAIRGVFRHGGRSFVHAGAGIMAESSPANELMETRHKLRAMKEALISVSQTPADTPVDTRVDTAAAWPHRMPKAS